MIITMRLFHLILVPLLLCYAAAAVGSSSDENVIELRVAVTDGPPMTMEKEDGTLTGFQIDLLSELQSIAKQRDNTTLVYNITDLRSTYRPAPAFDLVATNCANSTKVSPEDCGRYDLLLAPVFQTPDRRVLADLTPPFLQSYLTAFRYSESPYTQYSSFRELDNANGTLCGNQNSLIVKTLTGLFPNVRTQHCGGIPDCVNHLKANNCSLVAGFMHPLTYATLQDPTLVLLKEAIRKNYNIWSMPFRLEETTRQKIKEYVSQAVVLGKADEIWDRYFTPQLRPLGYAGENCTLSCHAEHGRSNAKGNCVCESTRWIGDDCATEVILDTGMIPTYQIALGYLFFATNAVVCVGCGVWLVANRHESRVRLQQPFFLGLVLLGCLVSSSTILALMQQADEGENHHAVPCMLIPWLYSVGFSITFGTLFTKIYRVRKVVVNAQRMRRVKVSLLSALRWIALVLVVDMGILVAWQVHDPLRWTRRTLREDKFGVALESVGACVSDHWIGYAASIGAFHFLLLAIGTYVCYATRKVPNYLSGIRGVSVAMWSNFQIFLIGIPVLIMIGSDPNSSFFLRAAMVWINDLVVVLAIFGDLIFGKQQPNAGGVRISGMASQPPYLSGLPKTTTTQSQTNTQTEQASEHANADRSHRSSQRTSVANENTHRSSASRHKESSPMGDRIASDGEFGGDEEELGDKNC